MRATSRSNDVQVLCLEHCVENTSFGTMGNISSEYDNRQNVPPQTRLRLVSGVTVHVV
jgi:hypothetical protein